jgi:hypothetical protein
MSRLHILLLSSVLFLNRLVCHTTLHKSDHFIDVFEVYYLSASYMLDLALPDGEGLLQVFGPDAHDEDFGAARELAHAFSCKAHKKLPSRRLTPFFGPQNGQKK